MTSWLRPYSAVLRSCFVLQFFFSPQCSFASVDSVCTHWALSCMVALVLLLRPSSSSVLSLLISPHRSQCPPSQSLTLQTLVLITSVCQCLPSVKLHRRRGLLQALEDLCKDTVPAGCLREPCCSFLIFSSELAAMIKKI